MNNKKLLIIFSILILLSIQIGLFVFVSGETSTNNEVLPSDTVLVRPSSDGLPIGPIVAYNMKDKYKWQGDLTLEEYEARYHMPIYKTFNRDTPEYWDNVVDEMLMARLHLAFLHARGCESDNPETCDGSCRPVGDMCPGNLNLFVEAVTRAEAEDVIRVGMWDATGTYDNHIGRPLDISNLSEVEEYFWRRNMKKFFDTIPENLWYKIDGKPVVAFWNLRDSTFVNQQGNTGAMINFLKNKFLETYGVEPFFIVQKNWLDEDTTLRKDGSINYSDYVEGAHHWIHPRDNDVSSYHLLNDEYWGCVANGFIHDDFQVDKRNGDTLREGLQEGVDKNAKVVLYEGMINMVEGCPTYRSEDWSYPSLYINIFRTFSDPNPETIRFQAEGADTFNDTTIENIGGDYSDRTINGNALDVARLADNTGWFVGWSEANEWIQYEDVKLGQGTYRLTARVSTNSENRQLEMKMGDTSLGTVTLPNTGGYDNYQLVHLGQIGLTQGVYDLKLTFVTPGINVDWFFVKRSSENINTPSPTPSPTTPTTQPTPTTPTTSTSMPTTTVSVTPTSVVPTNSPATTPVGPTGSQAQLRAIVELTIGDPYMYVNAQKREIDPGRGTRSIIVQSRTLLPIRAVMEAIGGVVTWDDAEKKATVTVDGILVELWMTNPQYIEDMVYMGADVPYEERGFYEGNRAMKVDGQLIENDVPPLIMNDRMFLPFRFIAESVGSEVSWDGDLKKVTLKHYEPE